MLLRLLDLKGRSDRASAAIIILQLACHPGVLAAVSPGLHVHLRAPHPPDLMGGIFLYGGTTGIMSCLIFDQFEYFLENNIFQHYNVWFYFIYLFSLFHGAHTCKESPRGAASGMSRCHFFG